MSCRKRPEQWTVIRRRNENALNAVNLLLTCSPFGVLMPLLTQLLSPIMMERGHDHIAVKCRLALISLPVGLKQHPL